MSYNELMDWREFYSTVEPFGERRADLRTALLCTIFAEPNRDKKKKKEPYKISDFMLFKDEEQDTGKTPSPLPSTQPVRATISSELVTGLFIAAAKTAAKRSSK